ncbi:MAG: molybdate ABC transporter substrate-binding protein [Gammaproteobacteria bacterium]|nr:molybdate ABC transporter substrate-binding protein [Gammaproteobacteria bacterium]MBU1777596.1 molybdate ABC transporter substrate-binding protein [Gammaproteobacteria bacterium]MBU1969371.1 molybdate ABC transporter substrate-binding protein [Gammaproteobacteria bacterium]
MKSIKLGLLGALLASLVQVANAGEVNAAVAANFTKPMEEIVAQFEKETGHTVKLSFGSSGKFTSQIKNGAPFDVFLAADEKNPKLLEEEGLAVKGSRFVYALGKLVLWSAQSGFVDDKGAVLGKGSYNKIAYADPKLAPYGLAAQEALQKLSLWDKVQGKLVTGESITQTYQFAATGNAELAFIALSQITKNGKVAEGSYWLVPSDMYNPIKQSTVQLSAAKDPAAAKAFMTFLKSEKALTIIRNFGYGLP